METHTSSHHHSGSLSVLKTTEADCAYHSTTFVIGTRKFRKKKDYDRRAGGSGNVRKIRNTGV